MKGALTRRSRLAVRAGPAYISAGHCNCIAPAETNLSEILASLWRLDRGPAAPRGALSRDYGHLRPHDNMMAATRDRLLGVQVGSLVGGAVITETVFAIPGIGQLMINSIFSRDYAVVQGALLVIAVLVSLVFLLTDALQAMLDPRIDA